MIPGKQQLVLKWGRDRKWGGKGEKLDLLQLQAQLDEPTGAGQSKEFTS